MTVLDNRMTNSYLIFSALLFELMYKVCITPYQKSILQVHCTFCAMKKIALAEFNHLPIRALSLCKDCFINTHIHFGKLFP